MMAHTSQFDAVEEEFSDTLGIRTKFPITEELRDKADEVLHQRDGSGNTATSDRGRDSSTQRKHSYIGCLGEVVVQAAFAPTPIEAKLGSGVEYDVGLTVPKKPGCLELEVKTRHHKTDINHTQRDLFIRKENPTNISADLIFGVKVYPNYRGEWKWAELLGYCTPSHADKWKVERQDISHYTKKWEIKERYLHDNFDTIGALVKKVVED